MLIEITLKKILNFFIISSVFTLLYLWSIDAKDIYITGVIVLTFFYTILNLAKREYLIFSFMLLFVVSMAIGKNLLPYYVILLSILLTFLLIKNIKGVILSNLFLTFSLTLGVIIISHFQSLNSEFSKNGIVSYFLILLTIYCISMIFYNYKFNITLLLQQFLLSNIFLLFIFYTNNTFFEITNTHRALIYFTEMSGIRSNTLAGIIAIFVPIILGFILKVKSMNWKVIGFLCILTNLTTLIILQSRGAYVGLVFALILLVVNQKFTKKIITLFVVFTATLLVSLVFPQLLNEIFGRFLNVNSEDLTNGRTPLYEASIKLASENFVFGSGINQLGAYMGVDEIVDAHNFLLTYLSSIGIIGLLFFLLYLLSILKFLFINLKWSKEKFSPILFLGLGVLVQVIHGLFEPTMTTILPLMLFAITSTTFYWATKAEKNELQINKLS